MLATGDRRDCFVVVDPSGGHHAAYSSAYSYLWNNSVELAKHLDTFSAAAFAELLSRTDARVWVA